MACDYSNRVMARARSATETRFYKFHISDLGVRASAKLFFRIFPLLSEFGPFSKFSWPRPFSVQKLNRILQHSKVSLNAKISGARPLTSCNVLVFLKLLPLLKLMTYHRFGFQLLKVFILWCHIYLKLFKILNLF